MSTPQPTLRVHAASRLRRLVLPVFVYGTLGYLSLLTAVRADEVAQAFRLDRANAVQPILLTSLAISMASFLAVAYRAIRSLVVAGKEYLALRKQTESNVTLAESGVAVVEYALVSPAVLLTMAMVIQLALIGEAALVVRYAALTTARSAAVHTKRDFSDIFFEGIDDEEIPARAGRFVLDTLSPDLDSTNDSLAKDFTDIFAAQNGAWGGARYHRRQKWTKGATNFDIELKSPPFEIMGYSIPLPIGDILSPQYVEVTVKYKYVTMIPGITLIPGITTEVNVNGYSPKKCFTITSTAKVQSTGARQTNPLTSMNPLAGSPLP